MSDVPSKRSSGSGRPAGNKERSAAPTPALDALLSGPAGNPVQRALWLDGLDLRLHTALPRELAAHARLANVDGKRLVYLVDSPVWHARLRLASGGLIEAARSIGLDVAEVVARTASRPLRPTATATRPAHTAGTSDVAGDHLRRIRTSLADAPVGEARQDGTDPDGRSGEA